jgi:hypothetical protein
LKEKEISFLTSLNLKKEEKRQTLKIFKNENKILKGLKNDKRRNYK